MTLPENRLAVQQIISELEPRIIGSPRPGFACGCGDFRCDDPVVAARIVPSGQDRPGLEVLWPTWTVVMETHEEGDSAWTHPLDYFVSAQEVQALFDTYFGSNPRFVPA